MIKGNMIPPIPENKTVISLDKKEVEMKNNDSEFDKILNKKIRKLNKHDR